MKKTLITTFSGLFLTTALVHAQTLILGDDYNVTGNGTGFALGQGVNTGINPPATRLTGTGAANLRYLRTGAKPAAQYSITDNRIRVAMDPTTATTGRFTLSDDGATPFDFSSVLGTGAATPANPVVYDVTIHMENDATGTARFSFAIATEEGPTYTWDFGIQLWGAVNTDTFYTIQKRIIPTSSGLASEVNAPITTTAPGTRGTEIPFLIRITDAGAETTTFSSRVQVSMDGGSTWFYDTAADPVLVNGWRFDGPGRYFVWDQAGNRQGDVYYDNFSVTLVPEPSSLALGLLGGLLAVGCLRSWRNRQTSHV